MKKLTLDKLNIGDTVLIKKINTQGDIRRRFFDIGLIEGTKVTCMLKNSDSSLLAYLVRGAVIAIRKEDLNSIIVEYVGGNL